MRFEEDLHTDDMEMVKKEYIKKLIVDIGFLIIGIVALVLVVTGKPSVIIDKAGQVSRTTLLETIARIDAVKQSEIRMGDVLKSSQIIAITPIGYRKRKEYASIIGKYKIDSIIEKKDIELFYMTH